MFDTVLFPTDSSPGAEAVREYVFDLAEDQGATLYVLYVAEPRAPQASLAEMLTEQLMERGRTLVAEVADDARARGIDVVEVVVDVGYSVPETIVEYAAEEGVDIIVVPVHGRRTLPRYLLGSVTERVVQQSSVPVLTVPIADDA